MRWLGPVYIYNTVVYLYVHVSNINIYVILMSNVHSSL